MDNSYNSYVKLVLNELLKLRTGDALSVNVEELDFDLAKIFATEALKITDVQVKIVVTNNGKPFDVVEFEPDNPGRTEVSGFALLRIAHITESESFESSDNFLDNYPEMDDLVSIQKYNHLAEPIVLNRRIAIPYCVVPSEPVRFADSISDRLLLIDYRQKFLNHSDIDKLHFVGTDTDFTVDVPSYSIFNTDHINLSNGRDFVCSTDFEKITVITDKDSINGYLSGITEIFGRKQKINLNYSNGKLIDCNDSKQLKTIMSYDLNIIKPGFLKMCDKCFELHLGGSLLSNFNIAPADEDLIPESFNQSLYCMKVSLPEDLHIFYAGCDGIEHELVRKGFFLE